MAIVFTHEESALLDKIAIDQALDTLPPLERDLIRCIYTYGDPPGDVWPCSYDALGVLLGQLHAGEPLCATFMRNLEAAVHRHFAYTYQSPMSDPFLFAHRKYTPLIRALARGLGEHDLEFVKDLCQEGDFALWRVGPEKWEDHSYCKAAIRFAMLDYRRRERRHVRTTGRPSRQERRRISQRPRALRRTGQKHRRAV